MHHNGYDNGPSNGNQYKPIPPPKPKNYKPPYKQQQQQQQQQIYGGNNDGMVQPPPVYQHGKSHSNPVVSFYNKISFQIEFNWLPIYRISVIRI